MRPVEVGEGELTVYQRWLLARIQLIGVVVLIVGSLTAGIFRSGPVVSTSLLAMVLIVFLLGWVAARVQQRPFPQLAWQSAKQVVADACRKPKEWLHRFSHR